MIIDLIFLALMGLAIFKGYSKGLVIALFSIAGFIIGLAAAIKLSAVVANKIAAGTNSSGPWLPFISFLIVFVGAMFLVRLGAKLVQKAVQAVMLGWVNRIAGAVFYALLYAIILSIFLFYINQLHLFSADTFASSKAYPYLKPLGPYVINSLGAVIPWFKNMFAQLQDFFSGMAAQPAK